MDPVAEYRAVLRALKPYLDDLVIIGGVAVRIFHFHANQTGTTPPVQTRDLDIATPRQIPPRGRRPLEQILLESGLTPRQTPVAGLPAPKVKYTYPRGGGEIEFLTGLRGLEGEEPALVQAGLYAEKLRYLDLLLERTLTVDVGEGIVVRVPHPGRLLFQKILCFEKRQSPAKGAKDLYYVHYLLDGFPTWRSRIASEITKLEAHPRWVAHFLSQFKILFLEMESPGPALVESQRNPGATPEKAVFEELVRRQMGEFFDTLEDLA